MARVTRSNEKITKNNNDETLARWLLKPASKTTLVGRIRMRAKKEHGQLTAPRRDSSANWAKGWWPSDAFQSAKVLEMFQPDILISHQYCANNLRTLGLEPEKLLMLAVLWDAITCFQANLGEGNNRKRQLFLDAEQWIQDQTRKNLFSFDNICDSLGFEPNYVRRGLTSWKETMVAERARNRVAS
jgi:hypothetical protein